MNILREYIRALLTESIDPKIASMIDRAEEAGHMIEVENGAVYLFDATRSEIAAVHWYSAGSKSWLFGPCLKASHAEFTYALDNFGPLVYDVAIEVTGGLTPDRSEVSEDARAVWDYYMKRRPDVIKQQLDNPYNRLTPEDEDNCSHPGEFSPKSSMSKKYSKTATPVMDELRRRGMLVE